ncbi:MAG TPA: GNAT family N-acetyltransferase [Xanthobacteraceae bacterium]|nr:GNAT family N-acetyltransferase [Xanthobacteraceae bacterium]
MQIRPAEPRDDDGIWRILAPVLRAGETYALPADMSRADALAYWCSPVHEVFVAEKEGRVVGTYYMRPNQQGGGRHVANCGYVTAEDAAGRGIGRAMGIHSLDHARARGFRSMQFNFVVATNDGAVRLWQSLGFAIVGRLKEAFHHPRLGYVDALLMQRLL